MYKIKDLLLSERPREKLISKGPSSLSTPELFSIIFNSGTRKQGVLELAASTIEEYGITAIRDCRDVKLLVNNTSLTILKASQVIAAVEIGRRLFQENSKLLPTMTGPHDVYKFFQDMQNLRKEELRALYLDARQKVIYFETVSVGSLNMNITSPREIFQPAIELLAAAVIIVHNHPSGETSPSNEDILYTKRIIKAGSILGVELLDHVIIAKDKWYSFKDSGKLEA